jgi:GTP-binding protein HflX
MREVKLASGRRMILSDTVGFISDLPTTLVAAFRATLEEVLAADLVLHVRDISHPETDAQRRDVERVLGELGIDAEAADARIMEVGNKVDRLDTAARQEGARSAERDGRRLLLVSAATGEGIDALLAAIDARLGERDEILTLEIPATQGRLLSWLHDNAEVLEQQREETGAVILRVRIDPSVRGKFQGHLKRAGLA